jgi:iron complex outermembrane receptor protein
VVEEIARGPLTLQFGARLDWTDISTETAPEPFGAGQDADRRTGSGALGATWDFDDEWAASFSYAYTQRPPLAQELFANGPHVATDTFEIGDPDLDVEQSFGFDAALKKRAGLVTGSLNGFYYYFEDFIALTDTGAVDPVDGLPVFQYANLPATFLGGEAELTLHLLETSEHSAHLDLRADYVRARDRETGDPLPRIPPLRLGAELAYHRGPLHLSGGVRFAAAQHRTADFETDTGSYTLLDASLAYELELGAARALLFLNATNLADRTARNSASFLKEIAPLPGRALRTGVRVTF